MKKPSMKTNPPAVKIYKYLYKATGVWGFKKNGKEVLRVPQSHINPKQNCTILHYNQGFGPLRISSYSH
jgi:hypothetical protein